MTEVTLQRCVESNHVYDEKLATNLVPPKKCCHLCKRNFTIKSCIHKPPTVFQHHLPSVTCGIYLCRMNYVMDHNISKYCFCLRQGFIKLFIVYFVQG